jgi:hypothetical protein
MSARKEPVMEKVVVGTDRERIAVEFRAEPGVNAILPLRRLLKLALRVCGLRCLAVRIVEK